MPANDLRRALDYAKNLLDLCEQGIGGDAHSLPNLKAVLREGARLHRKQWSMEITLRCMPSTLALGDVGKFAERLDEEITASPEWRRAFHEQYGIDPKEIDL